MRKTIIALVSGTVLLIFGTEARSHDVVNAQGKPVNTHEHVWKQQEYGKDYRQGHSVNGPQGDITIFSPNTYQGYTSGNSVRFARPEPYTKPIGDQANMPDVKTKAQKENEESNKRGYGNQP
jgi:hypothetical protein